MGVRGVGVSGAIGWVRGAALLRLRGDACWSDSGRLVSCDRADAYGTDGTGPGDYFVAGTARNNKMWRLRLTAELAYRHTSFFYDFCVKEEIFA